MPKTATSAFVGDPELIERLESCATRLHCDVERILFRQGDAPVGLYIVRSGEATLNMNSPSGQAVMSLRAGPGSLLGLPGVLGNMPYTLSASAQAGTELSFVTREAFSEIMLSEPQLSLRLLQVLAAEVRSARQSLTDS